MTSKVRAGRRDWEIEPVSFTTNGDRDADIEAEVAAVASWFASLPAALRAYLDHEARHGTEAYRVP
jgi:hypothetical protein